MNPFKLVQLLGFKIYSNTSGDFVAAKDLEAMLETAPCKKEYDSVRFTLTKTFEPKPVALKDVQQILIKAGLETMAENLERWGLADEKGK